MNEKTKRRQNLKKRKITAITSVLLACLALSSCSADAGYFMKSGTFRNWDAALENGIVFDDNITIDDPFTEYEEYSDAKPNSTDSFIFRMRIVDGMDIYENIGDKKPMMTLEADTVVDMYETGNGDWMRVNEENGDTLGYAVDGFLHAIDTDCSIYAELPIEYGKARTNSGTMVDAYSHLVDVRKYFKSYESTEYSNDGVDLSKYDIKISMKLSTSETSIGEPFYTKNLCLLQYDVIAKFKKAVDQFKKDGYTVVIYDAYRPTSVQQRWFNVVRVHKWVADPSIGMGGVHDRGTAIDMSLIDTKTGVELEMPTPMHTFTEASARSSKTMTETARKNMNYMLKVMQSAGFTYINSEWWHFQDVNTQYYLPTDHPIDEIPLAVVERQ